MNLPARKGFLEHQRDYSERDVEKVQVQPHVLNVRLIFNPFLEQEDNYKFLAYRLNDYNRRVSKEQVTDSYEAMVYERTLSMLAEIAEIHTKQDQVERLGELHKWFQQQDALIIRRRPQNYIRYQLTKQFRKITNQHEQRLQSQQHLHSQQHLYSQQQPNLQKHPQIPSEIVQKTMDPYYRKWRTAHPEIDIPLNRLKEFKRKTLNIAPFIAKPSQTPKSIVLYPKPPPLPQLKEDEHEEDKPNPQANTQDQQKQTQPIAQDPNNAQPKLQQQQDLGLGEQLPDPEEDEENNQDVLDKLKPKNKAYQHTVHFPLSQNPPQSYKEQFMSYKGHQVVPQRSMELKYVKIQQDFLKKQKEQRQFIDLAHQWAKDKSKVEKELQKKLQQMFSKPKYSFSTQEEPKIERLNQKDEIKYGLTVPIKKIQKNKYIDIGQTTKLPAISRNLDEKTIRKDRLQSLKNKFGKMLNLSDYQERETIPSICQVSPRRRGLSQILRENSKSKQRLIQLEQVLKIKNKVKGAKYSINLNSISQGLCLPQQQEKSTAQIIQFPSKSLPNNPFWVQPAKKKKKK